MAARSAYGNANDGTNYAVDAAGDTLLPGQAVPYGWLVTPHTSPAATAADPGPSVADIEAIVAQGIAEADQVRAQIRLPFNSYGQDGLRRQLTKTATSSGSTACRTPRTFRSAWRSPRHAMWPITTTPACSSRSTGSKGVPAGTAFTSRTFRYVSLPFFPEGIDINPPGPGNILTDGGVTKYATTKGAPLPVSAFQSFQGYNDFNPNYEFPRSVQQGQPERRRILPRQCAVVQGYDRRWAAKHA